MNAKQNTKYAKKTPNTQKNTKYPKKYTKYANKTPTTPKNTKYAKKNQILQIFIYAVLSRKKKLFQIHTLFGVLLQGGSQKIDKNRFGKFTYHRKGDCYWWWLSDPALKKCIFKLLKRLRP